MKFMTGSVVTLLLLAVGAVGFVYSGAFNFAADEPHSKVVHGVIETLRERSIARGAKAIEVPRLDDAGQLAAGAEHYAAMCTGCHLAPGMEDNDLRAGMYPRPPNLAEHAEAHGHDHGDDDAALRRQFWIIKHGVKASGMPAWGVTHDDNSVWALVAFLQKLPGMSVEEYAALTAGGAGQNQQGHGHGHAHGAPGPEAANGHVDAPGAPPHEHGATKPSAKGGAPSSQESHSDHGDH